MNAPRLLMALSALLGAAGVILYALAAHGRWSHLEFAAAMTLGHAAAIPGLLAARQAGLLAPKLSLIALFTLWGAIVLFTGAVVLGAMADLHPWPSAAPTGGTVAILAWLGLAMAALRRTP